MSNGEKNKNMNPEQDDSGCFQLIRGLSQLMRGASTTVIAIAVTVIAVVIIAVLMQLNSGFRFMGSFFNSQSTANVTSSRTIVTSLRSLGQLVSLSVELAQADIAVDVATGGLNMCAHSANHVAQGAVDAGIDITQVEANNVRYNEASDTYTITLPAAEITSCRIEYIRQYERDGGNVTCGIDWDNIRVLAQYEATRLFVEDSLQSGVLESAEERTTVVMESFISALTGSSVEIIYAESDEITLPPSCQPQLPRGWVFDEEQNKWVQEG